MRDYQAWHAAYDDPTSSLSERLGIVQGRLSEALDAQPAGPIRLISMCAGQGRDVVGVLSQHRRREDVAAVLVELDPGNAAHARDAAGRAGISHLVGVVEGDAATSDAYADWVPADIVLACGIFGNVEEPDIERTARHLSMLCAEGATVIWTRHRRDPELVGRVRAWFGEAGFEELAFEAPQNGSLSGVGTYRLVGAPQPYRRGFRFFTFVR